MVVYCGNLADHSLLELVHYFVALSALLTYLKFASLYVLKLILPC